MYNQSSKDKNPPNIFDNKRNKGPQSQKMLILVSQSQSRITKQKVAAEEA